jgi:hypothetical protein
MSRGVLQVVAWAQEGVVQGVVGRQVGQKEDEVVELVDAVGVLVVVVGGGIVGLGDEEDELLEVPAEEGIVLVANVVP